MKTYATMVLGCKVNDYEASYVEQEMNKSYRKVSFHETADIYLIFTCAVTNMAEAKSRKMIRAARRRNPNAFIAAIGCYVQTSSDAEVFKDVDLLIGSKEKDKIKQYIDEDLKTNTVTPLIQPSFEELPVHEYMRKGRAFLKIQDGCNQFCSYCIIPYARGRERSADHRFILKEAEELSKHTSEIVLTGIHTGRYFDGEYHLLDLLEDMVKINGIQTIRLSSIEVTELNDDLLNFMANEPKMAHHLHIPLQSGSDRILEKMHRPYTTSQFLKRVQDIRSLMPDCSVSTDLILGFPYEDEDAFNETLNFLKQVCFSFIHLFPYARKKGTLADRMDQFPNPLDVNRRIDIVNEVEKEYEQAFVNSFLNKEVQVFVETHKDGDSYGYTKEYIYTRIKGLYPLGSLVKVCIVQVEPDVIAKENYAAQ